MTDDERLQDFLETVTYVGQDDWRTHPELGDETDDDSDVEPRGAASRPETLLHQAADAHLDAVHLAIAYAFMRGKKAVDKSALRRATTAQQAFAATSGVPAAVKSALLRALPPVLQKTLIAGSDAGRTMLGQLKTAELRDAANDSFDEKAIEWAEEHAAELADGLSETSRDDIADAIASAFEGGDLSSAYTDILDAVGDSARASMIARTEIMRASHEGLQQSWNQAVDNGTLTGNEQKEWIATTGACDECVTLDGTTVGISDEFEGGNPPLHPSCRCSIGIAAGS